MLTKKNRNRLFTKFRKNSDGATAIEFAILAIPFFALLFGIIELAIVFFISSTTEHALATVSREIRTGEFQQKWSGQDQQKAEFKKAICSAMLSIGNCNNLHIDVVTAGSGRFTDLQLAPSPAPCANPCTETEPEFPQEEFDATGSGDVVIVRVQYTHKLAIPSALTGLANGSGNTRIITAVTAFRNEPF